MAGRSGKRRVLLLLPLLAGLFLMHGLTGGDPGGDSCHGMPPAPMAGVMSGAMAVASAHGVPMQATDAVRSPDPVPGHHAQAGQTCVPLRPEGMAGLFLALFSVIITVWWPRLPFSARLIRAHWPHGPPRSGVQVLRALSISRT